MHDDTGLADGEIQWMVILGWLLHPIIHNTGVAINIRCTVILGWPRVHLMGPDTGMAV
jgi:hypothetical protein